MESYNISNIVKTMVENKQPFNNYEKSTEDLSSKYEKTEKQQKNKHITTYKDENGNIIAISMQEYDNKYNERMSTIYYKKNAMSYSTGWQIKNENNDNNEFKFISGMGYTIEDSHTNGYVDNYDEITLGNGKTMTVDEFLNSQA